MKKFSCFLSLCILLTAASWACGQEAVIKLNTRELGSHKRPLVIFPHQQHEETIDCRRCHHDYDNFGANVGDGEGQACAGCHKKRSDPNPVPLVKAFHLQCKGCHRKVSANRAIMCGQCHRRQR